MGIQRQTASSLLLLDPSLEQAVQLASQLEAAGFEVHVEGGSDAALQAMRRSFFFALIVFADLTSQDCLAALEAMRRKAPRTWMIVAAPRCDLDVCDLIHRHGGDACVAIPISVRALIDRLAAFQQHERPAF